MIKKILKFYNKKSAKPSSAFSCLFTESSSKERKKVIKDIVKAANKDQRAIINKYERIYGNSN